MRRHIRAGLGLVARRRKVVVALAVPALLLGVNVPPAVALAQRLEHQRLVSSPAYQSARGRWDIISLPANLQVNAVHAALLPTGKLLIVAGSGNDQAEFDAGTFRTLVYDPATGVSHLVDTPTDLFCAGHAFLPDGKLLVAGGTKRYEKLAEQVTRAAGVIVVKNESPQQAQALLAGTEFVAPDGRRYAAANDFTLPAATKKVVPGGATVTASQTRVFVESLDQGAVGVTAEPAKYTVEGLTGASAHDVYGMGQQMTLDKQEYQGSDLSYEFDPVTESYVRVGDLHEPRWYPSLLGLPNGQVLAVSGLDGTGQILAGQNEVYNPVTKTWTARPDLFRYFPTYPALFQTQRAGEVFYSGSNSGYGPATAGRQPGFWDLDDNTFSPVAGMRDPDLLETSGSAFAGPVQDQKIIVVGGGGVGESARSTARIDVVDVSDPAKARFSAGPDLPVPTRYPNVVQLPDDSLLISNGSRSYRGRGASDNLRASLYHPDTNTLSPAADPAVGRDYHSEGLLLPNGQVMTLGGNSLFSDAANSKTAPFEKRLEVYTPPYLLHGAQPVISSAPTQAKLGDTLRVTSPQAAGITKARLVRPSAATHATDLEQRSVALDITRRPDGSLGLAVPKQATLVPPGYYMLFLVDGAGTPSVASWVHVS